MKNITLKQAHALTNEPIDTLRKRVKRSGIPYHYAHGELVFPIVVAMPDSLAERVLKSIVYENR